MGKGTLPPLCIAGARPVANAKARVCSPLHSKVPAGASAHGRFFLSGQFSKSWPVWGYGTLSMRFHITIGIPVSARPGLQPTAYSKQSTCNKVSERTNTMREADHQQLGGIPSDPTLEPQLATHPKQPIIATKCTYRAHPSLALISRSDAPELVALQSHESLGCTWPGASRWHLARLWIAETAPACVDLLRSLTWAKTQWTVYLQFKHHTSGVGTRSR